MWFLYFLFGLVYGIIATVTFMREMFENENSNITLDWIKALGWPILMVIYIIRRK